MRFRTEIECRPSAIQVSHDTPMLLLGSCFTDEIGARLDADGFDTMHNPMGPLYNPCALLRFVEMVEDGIDETDLVAGPRGMHCLDLASRYAGTNTQVLLADINATLAEVRAFLERRPVVFVTLGSAFVFTHTATGRTVGNCHKFPAGAFSRSLLTVGQATAALARLTRLLLACACPAVVITVSPIRHLADGLHGNTLSKSTLQLAAAAVTDAIGATEYFPSYEMLIDDLRDYRFYADDMKHPSAMAVRYIYDLFSQSFFTPATLGTASAGRRLSRRLGHRSF